MQQRRLTKSIALLAAAGLLVAACGGDDGTDSDVTDVTQADATDTAADDTATDDTATDDTATDDTAADDTAADSADTAESADTADDAPADTAADTDTEVVETDQEARMGGSISVALEAEAVGLRPWEDTCSSPCYNILSTIYDKLIEQKADGTYGGFLAESIEPNEDFTAWTMTLRPDVVFHNGTPLTAQTITDMFPIQQEGATSSGSISSANLEGVEATADLEVTYTLSKANSAFPAFLSRAPIGMVFEPEAAAADPDGYSTNPIGTGPFEIESRDLDNETVVVRNEDYWGVDPGGNQLPYLDSISFRPIPDEGTRLDALLSGTVDAFQTLRQGTIRDAREAGDSIKLLEFQGNNIGGGMFNVLVPPFDDVRVRRGLTQMNSQENVIEALGGTGISSPGTQWFSPDSVWYSQKAADAWPKFDFEAGKATLAEYINDAERSDGKAAGEPIDVELSCPPDPTLIAAMQVLEQTWTASEMVTVSLTNFDQQTHINNALGSADDGFVGTHQAHCWRVSDDNDPSISLNPALAPPTAEIAEEAGLPGVVSPLNFPNYWSPSAFQAAQDAIKTDVFEERFALYEQIMLDFAENVPIWYSGYTATAFGTAPNVEGLNGWHLPDGSLGIGFPAVEGRYHEVFLTDG